MSAVQQMNLHLQTFFLTHITTSNPFSPHGIALEITDLCFMPIHSLYEKVLQCGPVPSFLVEPGKQISVQPIKQNHTSTSTKVSDIVLGVLWCIPGLILGTVIKVILLITSHFYRNQHLTLVNDHLMQVKRSIDVGSTLPGLITGIENMPADVFTKNAQFFSVQDLGRMAQVCKEWKLITKSMWVAKGQSLGLPYSTEQETKDAIKQKIQRIEASQSRLPPLGIEQLLEMPVLELAVPNITDPNQLKANKTNLIRPLDLQLGKRVMARAPSYQTFAFRCHCMKTSQAGIMTINTAIYNSHVSDKRQFFIFWWPVHPSALPLNCYQIDPSTDLSKFLKERVPVQMKTLSPIGPNSLELKLSD